MRDEYLYASGVVRFLENKLLNPTDIERMVDAPDLESAFKVFYDTDYYDNVLDVKPTEFLQALDADLAQVREKIIEMCPDRNLIEFLFMRYDYHNIKLLLKAKYSRNNLDKYLSELGNQDVEKLKLAIEGDSRADLLDYTGESLGKVNQALAKQEVTAKIIDTLLDREYFRQYLKKVKVFKSQWLKDLVKLQIDITNIKIFIRSKKLELTDEHIIQGGNPGIGKLKDLSEEEGISQIRFYMPKAGQAALDDYLKNKSLGKLEKDLENLELDYVRQAKFVDFGPEVVAAYYLAKKNAVRNVRLIMTGKMNQIPTPEIKELVREIY